MHAAQSLGTARHPVDANGKPVVETTRRRANGVRVVAPRPAIPSRCPVAQRWRCIAGAVATPKRLFSRSRWQAGRPAGKLSVALFLGISEMLRLVTLVSTAAWLAACSSAYYSALESVGVHKREILVDRVADAREAQVEARDQFQSALEEFTAVVGFEGGELESVYKKLNRELERSEDKAERVHDRIDAVEDVSKALFKEWEQELSEYSSASLRVQSQRQLDDTRDRYDDLMAAMRRAEERIDPVLAVFRDQVLYLKHNLNLAAIASLEGEAALIETDVDALIEDMNRSIAEADAFIQTILGS